MKLSDLNPLKSSSNEKENTLADNKENTSTRKTTAAAAETEVVTVAVHRLHEEKATGDRVIPFFVENDVVRYAPEGSGREFRTSVRDFLDRFQVIDEA